MGVFGVFFGCRGDGGFNVTMFLRPVREKVRPARPGADASAKKFAQRAQKGQKLAFYGVLGEFFRGHAPGGPRWASFFADQHSWDPTKRVCCAMRLAAGPVYWQC